MRLYADEAAFVAYFPETTPPANLDVLLRQASRLVDRILTGRVYDTDEDGMPTDPDVALTLSDATCAIAGFPAFATALTSGGSVQWDNVKIGSVSLSGRLTEATTDVDGFPVPAGALSALTSVGRMSVVQAGGGYVRPLDRITT